MLPRRKVLQLACLLIAVLQLQLSPLPAETLDEWVTSERDAAQRKLLAAVGRNGAVIASPDQSTPDQNYYFHWIRDAALTMDVVVTLYQTAPDAEDRDEYDRLLRTYVTFSRKNQTTSLPAGLGEPKFLVSGNVFTDPWGRPQNDGPALRTITLARWSQSLLDADPMHPLVHNQIRDIIKADLAFVRAHWNDKCTDLWEEVRGKHFYTRLVIRRALVDGAALLTRVGNSMDTSDITDCNTQRASLETALASHFDAAHQRIVVTLDIEGGDKGKTSQLDAAVILASLHAHTPGLPFFAPTDDRVLSTATLLRDDFASRYGINTPANSTDSEGQAMEPAIGRYPEDVYDGDHNVEGNPWFLTTAAFAELAYRARADYQTAGTIAVTDLNLAYLTAARTAGGSTAALTPGTTLAASDTRFTAITTGLQTIGDRSLRRLRRHAADDGTLSEQFKRNTGFMTGAVDLTWSYAATLTAVFHR